MGNALTMSMRKGVHESRRAGYYGQEDDPEMLALWGSRCQSKTEAGRTVQGQPTNTG
jgi:hypothetical protein